MKTQIILNENKEIKVIILPDKINGHLYKLYSCDRYGMRLNMTFKGVYNDDQLISVEELRTIYTITNDLKKAIKQDLLKAYNTTNDLKGAYLKAGGALGWWEHDITNSYEDFKEQAQTRALRTISGIADAYEKKQNANALNASESTLIEAYAFTLLTNEEQHKAIERTLKADDYKQEEARRLSDYLRDAYINEYSKCDYIKTLLSIQDIMQCAFCELLGEFNTLPKAQALYESIKSADDMIMPTRSEEERQYIIGKSLFSEDEQIECKEVK